MRQHHHLLLAAAMAAGLCLSGWPTTASAQQQPQTPGQQMDQAGQAAQRAGERMGQAADQAGQRLNQATGRTSDRMQGMSGSSRLAVTLPQGITPKEQQRGAADEAIRDVIRTATEAATSGDLDKLKEQLATPDRDRLGDIQEQGRQQLQGTLDQLRTTWRSKYNTDFKVQDEEAVFGPQFTYTSVGEISDPSQLAGQWPLQATMQAGETRAPQAAQPGGQPGTTEQMLDRGRDVAVVVIPAGAGVAELTVSMIHEAPDFWKIDIPDHIDGQTFVSSLNQHLSQVNQMSAQWPADPNMAYLAIAHHVLQAVYDVSPRAGQQSQAGQTSRQGQQPGQTGQQPGQSGQQPGQTGQQPGQSGQQPGQTGQLPGQQPGQSGQGQ